jgi:hypothetical protein
LFLPILVPVLCGTSPIYRWSQPSLAADELSDSKAIWLNGLFFTARAIFYFLVWAAMALRYYRTSARQDKSGDPLLTRRMEKEAPVAMILFALTITFAAFDWIMSLEPLWSSTIFGVYFYAGSVVAGLAGMILFAIALQSGGLLARAVSVEHYHDLGKLLLGFIVFWGYMAFSQYLLIWYANIPEETVWYLARLKGFWGWVALVLLFGHLFIPFLALLPRAMKRRKMLLGVWAVWMLAVHWIDLYWLVMPTFAPDRSPFGAMDVCCFISFGCLFLAGTLRIAGLGSLAPVGDPRLGESLAFENP